MNCPFVYANGHRCGGGIWQARAYGKHRNGVVAEADVRKIRLWCSEKGDHAGAVSTLEGKCRMEFYPDQLAQKGLYKEAITLCDNVLLSEATV